jgi:hypothetical protein
MHTRRWICALTLTLAALSGCSHDDMVQPAHEVALLPIPAPPGSYYTTTLPLPPFSRTGGALGINDAGWVVGWTDSGTVGAGRAPTLWKPGQAPIRLYVDPAFASTGGEATDIDSYGDVVGYTSRFLSINDDAYFGYVWPVSGKLRQGPIAGFKPFGISSTGGIISGSVCSGPFCTAAARKVGRAAPEILPCPGASAENCKQYGEGAAGRSVNDRGEIAGSVVTNGSPRAAIVWTVDNFLLDMARVSGNYAGGGATHITNGLSISGWHLVNGARRPVLWSLLTGSRREVGNGVTGEANSVSENNRVVGTADMGAGGRAFTATSAADFGALPLPKGYASSSAADVNACGSIVGTLFTPRFGEFPVVWQATANGKPWCDTPQPAP